MQKTFSEADAVNLLATCYEEEREVGTRFEVLDSYSNRFAYMLNDLPGYSLATAYMNGLGTTKDEEAAWRLAMRASKLEKRLAAEFPASSVSAVTRLKSA